MLTDANCCRPWQTWFGQHVLCCKSLLDCPLVCLRLPDACLATAARTHVVTFVVVPSQSHQQQQRSTEVHAQQATLRPVTGPSRGPQSSAPQCKLGFWSPARHTWHPITRGTHGQPRDGCAAKKETTAGTSCTVIDSNAVLSWLTCVPSCG